jgi:sugar-specific transcriptional regulator TrmB
VLVCSASINRQKLKPTKHIILTNGTLAEGRILETHFSKLQVLEDLGLTSLQARIYIALLESEPLKVSEISEISKVARPDVYRNLSELQKKGLIERIINKPVEYRAISMKKGLVHLLEAKTQHYEKVRAETRMLLDAATMEKVDRKKQVKTSQFVMIPKGKPVIEEIKTAIEKAECSVDLVLSWKRFSQGIASVFDESIEIAWAKNLKIRFIIESPPKNETAKQLIQLCREKPFCEIRFIPSYPETIFGIYDRKEIFMILDSKTDLPNSPALWSNNPSLIGLAKDHFEILWLTSMEELTLESCHFQVDKANTA